MTKDRDRDEDRRKDEEDLSDVFEDLGRDFSRLMEKITEGSGIDFGLFGNIDEMEDMDDMDMNDLQDLFKQFGMGGENSPFGSFGDFDSGPERTKSRKGGGRAGGSSSTGKEREEVRSPEVDIFDEEDDVQVFVELPGVAEDDISLTFEGSKLHLRAGKRPNLFRDTIDLPVKEVGSMRKSFKNGILHLTLEKTGDESSQQKK